MPCHTGCPFDPGEYSEGPITNAGYPVLDMCGKCRSAFSKDYRGFCSNCGELVPRECLTNCCGADMMRQVRADSFFVKEWNKDPQRTLGSYVDMSIHLAQLAIHHEIDLMVYLGESLTLVKRCMNWFVNEKLEEAGVARRLPGVKVSGSLTTGGEGAKPSVAWQEYLIRKLEKGIEQARQWNPSGPTNLKVGVTDYASSGSSFKVLCKFLSGFTIPGVEKFQVVMFCNKQEQSKLENVIRDYDDKGKFAKVLFIPYDDFLSDNKLGGDGPKNFLGRGAIKRRWDDFGEKRRYVTLETGEASLEDEYFDKMKLEIHTLLQSGQFIRK
ncbi:hypothetical protein [Corallococcus exercitus]|uniref:hypothetical protein n=1 Tax=Corallococcus exercitus TaxID=2316736 RepID=UPI0035D3EAE3